MPRDRAKEVTSQGTSMLLNTNRDKYCEIIAKGVADFPGIPKDEDDYYTVSYHVAGKRPAWVMQSRLRKKYPQLDTKVVSVVDKTWTAEVRVKLKPQTEGEHDGQDGT